MKKILLLILVTGFYAIGAKSQLVANYSFSTANVNYTEITGGVSLGDTITDDQKFLDPAVPLGSYATTGVGLQIGFNFIYNGELFDVFGINANGWIGLGKSTLTPSVNLSVNGNYSPISSTCPASVPAVLQQKISAFGRDLKAQTGASLRYETIGSAPNRILVVQWKHYRKYSYPASTNDDYNFQIRLYETSNNIEYIYGTFANSVKQIHTQVGIRGTSHTDYNNRTTMTDWNASVAGTADTATMNISSTVFPPSGLVYKFTPPPPPPHDAGVITINSPTSANNIPLGNNNINVTIENFGTTNLTSATIAWKVNGVLQSPYTYSNTVGLPIYSSDGPITIGSYNFATIGYYTVKVWTENPNGNADTHNSNDTASVTVFAYTQAYATLPLSENFDGTWINLVDTSDVPSNYWINDPAYGNPSWRRDDQGATANWTSPNYGDAGITSGAEGSAHYARFHTSWVQSIYSSSLKLFLDFTPYGTKILKYWFVNKTGKDTLSVYLSLDGGSSYNLLKKLGRYADWTQDTIILTTYTPANAILQFKAKSDYQYNDSADFGIDNITVYIPGMGIGEANTTNAVVNIFPNPTNGLTYFDIRGINNANIEIYSIHGQMVYFEKITGTNYNKQSNLSYLPKGVYMIRISDEKNNVLRKLIIQ